MNQKDNFKSTLPMAALDEIPQPSENATEYLKALPDGKETNNLSSLPTVR